MDASSFAQKYLSDLSELLSRISTDDLARAMTIMEAAFSADRQVFIAGNGGSAATASHMANDLMKTVAKTARRSMRAIALSDNVPLLTAIGNDESFEEIFSGQLSVLSHPGDILIVISGSGNSPNIIRSLEVAKEIGITSIAFLGKDGGKAKDMADVSIVVPSNDYGPIEDAHVIFNHLITEYLKGA